MNRAIYSWPVIFLLVLITVFLSRSVWKVYLGERLSDTKRQQFENILKELEERQKNFLSDIDLLKTQKGLEMEIRDKFRVVKEGEQLAIIVQAEEKEIPIIEEVEIPWWKKIKDLFLTRFEY
ncbi:MAG: hypothetical protein V1851_01530 [Patescibacteria group bacterium]